METLKRLKVLVTREQLRSFQSNHPNLKVVLVHHLNKKGEWLITKQDLPMGRKKKLGG